jgi:flavodoxin
MPRFHDETLYKLAQAARPLDDSDYGSDRQVTAQNEFFEYVEKQMHPTAFAELDDFALKATPDEMIDEAIKWLEDE